MLNAVAQRRRFDRLAFLSWHFDAGGEDLRPSIEPFHSGWVFTVTVPGPRLILYLFFEAAHGIPPRRSLSSLQDVLASCPHAQSRVQGALRRAVRPPKCHSGPAHSTLTFPAAGQDWCLVGDAAQSFDPLSSLGLAYALEQAAEVGAHVLNGTFSRDWRTSFECRRLDRFQRYLEERREYYAAEQRWGGHPFWREAAAGFRTGSAPLHGSADPVRAEHNVGR